MTSQLVLKTQSTVREINFEEWNGLNYGELTQVYCVNNASISGSRKKVNQISKEKLKVFKSALSDLKQLFGS